MAAKKKTSDLVKVGTQETALANGFEFGDMPTGFEDMRREEMSIPYLTVLQPLSPQVVDGPAQIDGAKAGMLMNTVTKQLFEASTGVIFQPVVRQYMFVEWKDREVGGGVVAIHDPDDKFVKDTMAASKEFGKYRVGPVAEGVAENSDDDHRNHLKETFYLVGKLLSEEDEDLGQIMVSFTSTKIKVYKDLITSLRTILVKTPDGGKKNPPIFLNRVRLTSIFVDKGAKKKFHNFVASPARGDWMQSLIVPPNALLDSAVGLHQLVTSGDAKIDHAKGDEGDAPQGGQGKEKTNIPF